MNLPEIFREGYIWENLSRHNPHDRMLWIGIKHTKSFSPGHNSLQTKLPQTDPFDRCKNGKVPGT